VSSFGYYCSAKHLYPRGRPRAIPWSSFGARDGAYRLSQTVWEDLNFFTLSFLFVDENFRVTAVEVQNVPKGFGRRMIDKIPFAITLPFSEKYKSVVTSYSFSALGT